MQQKMEVGQRITALDVAEGLQDQEGTFNVQHGGQSYTAVSKAGHSIVSFKPVGVRLNVPMALTAAQEPWIIEKVSNFDINESPQRR